MASRQRSRSRSPVARLRVSYEQVEALVDYLESNRELATGYLSTTAGRYKASQKWQAVAVLLNSIGGGATKDAKGWSAFWSNFKNKLKSKLRAIRLATTGTGGGRPRTACLDEVDERVVRLLGPSFGASIPGVRVDPQLQEETEAETMHEMVTAETVEYVVELDNIFSGELSLPREGSSPAASQSILSATYSPPALIASQPAHLSVWPTPPPVPSPARIAPPPPTPSTSRVVPPPAPSTSRVVPPPAPSTSRVVPPPAPSTSRVVPPPAPSTSRVVPPPAPSTSRVVPPPAPSTSRVVPPPAPSTSRVVPPPAPSASRVAQTPAPSPSRVAPPSRPRTRRRRCVPLTSALEAAQNAVTEIERGRLQAERDAVRNAADSAAALQRVAAAIEAQAEQAAGLTAAVRALAAAQSEQAAAMQALVQVATAALRHFGAESQ